VVAKNCFAVYTEDVCNTYLDKLNIVLDQVSQELIEKSVQADAVTPL
jgi:hypothetical protein